MKLRNGKTMVPELSSATGSPTGSIEMDARSGTSTGNNGRNSESVSSLPSLTSSSVGKMGHSANKSHSSGQDADETGHRSRSDTDVGIDLTPADVVSPSPAASQDDGVVVEGQAASLQSASQDSGLLSDAAFDPRGFTEPKRSSRASSVRSVSPVLDTSTRFFAEWFSRDADESAAAEDSHGDLRTPIFDGDADNKSWADYSDEDGLG
jgi:hypothetical protein